MKIQHAENSPLAYNPLGLIRIAAVLYFLFFVIGTRFGFIFNAEGTDPDLITRNMLFRWFDVPFPFDLQTKVFMEKTWLGLYRAIFYLFCLLAGIGLFTRFSLFSLAVLSLYFNAGYAATHQYNHESLLTQHLLFILAFAPGSKALSLDAALRAFRKSRRDPEHHRTLAAEAIQALRSVFQPRNAFFIRHDQSWGVKLTLALFFVVYFAAGISKLALSEGRWFDGETLRYYLSRDTVEQLWIAEDAFSEPFENGKPALRMVDHTYGFEGTQFGRLLAQSKLALLALSVSTLLWELSPFLLFMRPLYRNAYLIGSVCMHIGIGLTMKLGFPSYQVYLLLLVDWPALFRGAKKRIPLLSSSNPLDRLVQVEKF